MTIKAITFDFWQTIYKNRPTDRNTRMTQLKDDLEQGCGRRFTPDQISSAVNVARDAWNQAWQFEHRTLSAHDWITVMLGAMGVTMPPADQHRLETRLEDSLLDTPPEPVSEIADVLARLAQRYKLGVISDTGLTPGRVLRHFLEKDGLLPYFTHLTFSDELGRSKPHPQAFLSTLDKLDAQPAAALHVGDLLRTDVLGAQNVGMRGVQYIGVSRDKWSQPADQPAVTPDAVITSHTELFPLLNRWRGPA